MIISKLSKVENELKEQMFPSQKKIAANDLRNFVRYGKSVKAQSDKNSKIFNKIKQFYVWRV